MQIIAETRRLRNAKSTSQSVTEQHSALDDDPLAGLVAASKKRLIALLKRDVHGSGLKGPWCRFDVDLRGVIFQQQGAGRHHRPFLAHGPEIRRRKHSRTQTPFGIVERDADRAKRKTYTRTEFFSL